MAGLVAPGCRRGFGSPRRLLPLGVRGSGRGVFHEVDCFLSMSAFPMHLVEESVVLVKFVLRAGCAEVVVHADLDFLPSPVWEDVSVGVCCSESNLWKGDGVQGWRVSQINWEVRLLWCL